MIGFVLIFLQLSLVSLQSNGDIQCGIPGPALSTRIMYGQDTQPGEYPWHTAIYLRETFSMKYSGGGTLISERFVLTAGHCVTNASGVIHASETLFIRLGIHDLRQERNSQPRGVANIYREPSYDPETLANDIALLKLDSSAEYSAYIRPACLYDEDNLVGQLGTVIGWGYTEKDALSDVLKSARIPVIDHQTCLESDRDVFGQVLSRRNMCAGFANETTACNGDSGGGLFFESQAVWYLGGIVSFSVLRDGYLSLCSTNSYGIYTKVSSYLPWIHRIMEKDIASITRHETTSTTQQPLSTTTSISRPLIAPTNSQMPINSSVFNHNRVVVCYIQSWAYYGAGTSQYSWEHFDPQLCTHAIYAFAGLDVQKSGIRSLDTFLDLKQNYGRGAYAKYVGLKETFPHLKVLLAVGGTNEGSTGFSKMAADPTGRQTFVKNALEFIKQHGFDGLDLDWEYPTQRGGKPNDRENFAQLVNELSTSFKRNNLLLTAVISAEKHIIDAAYDFSALSKYLDQFHITSYNYRNNNERNKASPTAPLQSADEFNIEFTVNHLTSLGVPANKIVLGVSLHGSTGGSKALEYGKICQSQKENPSAWKLSWDPQASQVIGSMSEGNSVKTVVYDSTRSVANKARFAVRQNLAGLMVWSVDADDFRGVCDSEKDTYVDFGLSMKAATAKDKNKILKTINDAIVLAIQEKS